MKVEVFLSVWLTLQATKVILKVRKTTKSNKTMVKGNKKAGEDSKSKPNV